MRRQAAQAGARAARATQGGGSAAVKAAAYHAAADLALGVFSSPNSAAVAASNDEDVQRFGRRVSAGNIRRVMDEMPEDVHQAFASTVRQQAMRSRQSETSKAEEKVSCILIGPQIN